MRPLTLDIEGFHSYREPTFIDLSAVTLAVIVGANGAGKSSILDAMRFALYGTSRDSLEQTINTDSDRASVTFTFELSGATYRASRSVGRGAGKHRATLDVEDPSAPDGWRALADDGVRSMTSAVSTVLGLDADTLDATVFCGQGQAGMFTGATSKARKEILSQILGLGRYDQLAVSARAHATTSEQEANTAERVAAEHQASLATEADDRAALEQITTDLAALRAQATVDAQSATEHAAAATDAETALLTAKATLDAHRNAQAERARLALSAHTAAENAHTAALARRDRAAGDVRDAEEAAALLTSSRENLTAARSTLTQAETDLEQVTITGQGLRESNVRLTTSLGGDRSRLGELLEQLDRLNAATDTDAQACPTCAQPLHGDSAHSLADRLATQVSDLEIAIAAQDTDLATVTADLAGARERHTTLTQARDRAREDVSGYERRIAGFESRAERLTDVRAEHHAAQQAVDDTWTALSDLGPAPDTNAPDPVGDTLDAAVRTAHTAHQHALSRAQDATSAAERTKNHVHEQTIALTRLDERIQAHDRAHSAMLTATTAAATARSEATTWTDLARAFGPTGVPHMIFRGICEELSAHINDVLHRLSDGALTVELLAERATRKGTVRDELDIVVHGPDGPRPFSTFSGGQQFRVDLALRVGLSRLLANRSGTPVRTLVIDEGWGSLDADGIAGMIDCLRMLTDDFDCVLSMTHVDAVVQAFQSAITVSNNGITSSVDVTINA